MPHWSINPYTTPAPLIPIPNPYRDDPFILHPGDRLAVKFDYYLDIPPGLEWAFYFSKQRILQVSPYRSTPERRLDQYLGYLGFDAVRGGYGLPEDIRGSTRDGRHSEGTSEVDIVAPTEAPAGHTLDEGYGTYDVVFEIRNAYHPYFVAYFVIPCALAFEEKDKCTPLVPELLTDVHFTELTKPDIWAAGEDFRQQYGFTNRGEPGRFKVAITRDAREMADTYDIGKEISLGETIPMPYDDLAQKLNIRAISEALPLTLAALRPKIPAFGLAILYPYNITIDDRKYENWVTTDIAKLTSIVGAGFAKGELGTFEYPEMLKPGDKFSIDLPVRNTGYRGETGLRLFDGETELERLERIDSGATTWVKFSSEMPVVNLLKLRLNPIHLDRGRAVAIDETKEIEIWPMNALFHGEKIANIFGGYAELNTFTGFVAGKNVRVSGLSTILGTGGPLGGIIPYSGYILSGDLGPGDVATIEFDELYFLRVETTRGIATARLGNLIERDAKLYEYSTIPTPAMMFQPVNLLTTSMRKAAPRLEVSA